MSICAMCNKNETPIGFKTCIDCRKRSHTNGKVRKAMLIKLGLCIICGDNPAIPDHRLCKECNDRQNKDMRDRRAALILQGLCVICKKERPDEGKHTCPFCHDKHQEKERKLKKSRRDAGLCIYCAQPLFLPISTYYCEKHWKKMVEKSEYIRHPRIEILERDNYSCQICYERVERQRAHIHHLDGDETHNDYSNLITLCQRCHNAITDLLLTHYPLKVIEFFNVHYSKSQKFGTG